MMADKTKPAPKKDEGFYEYMPGAYMDSYELFPADEGGEQEESAIRGRMIRQLVILVGLLIVQFVLFAILLKSTVNLG
jgi:hypothetical protein